MKLSIKFLIAAMKLFPEICGNNALFGKMKLYEDKFINNFTSQNVYDSKSFSEFKFDILTAEEFF